MSKIFNMRHKLKYLKKIKICTKMQKQLFSIDSTGHAMFTFLMPIKQHTFVKGMFLHRNPDKIKANYNQIQSDLINSKLKGPVKKFKLSKT